MNIQNVASRSPKRNSDSTPVALVIVTYNSADVLPGLLDSLPDGLADVERCRVLVVDNDSHDRSADLAAAHPTQPDVIRTGRNAGYAAGINAAAKNVSDETDILVLNPDIRLLGGTVKTLQRRLHQPGTGIVVPKILHTDGSIALSLRREPSLATVWSESILGGGLATRIGTGEIVGDPRLYERGGSVEWATGAALMVSAEARRRVGPWDESFFLYSEEVDYMRRTREIGYSVDYVCEAQVTHIGGEYTRNPFLSGLMTTNRIRDYGRRHGPLRRGLFRLGVAAGAALRSPFGSVHRATLRAALTSPPM